MKQTKISTVQRGICAIAAATLGPGQAAAREPGVLTTIPPGASIGIPIASPTPVDGIFVSSRSALSYQDFYDQDGNETPTELTIRDTVLQFAVVPGNQVLGGQYRAFLSVPFVEIEGENIETAVGPASDKNSGIGNIEIRPIDVSWELEPGVFTNLGISVFAPGEWSATELVNPGQNFWSVSPSLGYSYLRDGWNVSTHLLYFANFENEDNGYKSGDEVNLNLTAMKEVGYGLSAGAVGYARQQITDDENPDGAFGGLIAENGVSTGGGLSVTQQLGPITLNAMYTRDFYSKNSGGGDRFWFNAAIPVKIFQY